MSNGTLTPGGRPTIPADRVRPVRHGWSERSQIAFVLTGGGAKGCFQAGACKALWDEGIRPDAIYGVSVGALNGAKLAEGNDSSGDDLVDLWLTIADAGNAAVFNDMAVADEVLGRIKETATDQLDLFADIIFGSIDASDVRAITAPLSALTNLHDVTPLRTLIQENFDPFQVHASGIELRIGITDLESGSFWTVTGPRPGIDRGERFEPHSYPEILPGGVHVTWAGVMEKAGPLLPWTRGSSQHTSGFGLHEIAWGELLREPDTLEADSASQEVRTLFNIYNAIYASAAIPVYFPGLFAYAFPIPGSTNFQMAVGGPEGSGFGYERSFLFPESQKIGTFFDGGLRDIVPIRTAIRLGASEIYVISASRLFKGPEWQRRTGLDSLPGDIPIVQYLNGLLEAWGSEVKNNDLWLAVAFNEFVGWMSRMFSFLDERGKATVRSEFDAYWANENSTGEFLRNALASYSWLGGRYPFTAQRDRRILEYGSPFDDGGVTIHLIQPDYHITDVLDFSHDNIVNGIDHGEQRGMDPITISTSKVLPRLNLPPSARRVRPPRSIEPRGRPFRPPE